MPTALIYSQSGGGKTVNATRVATRNRGRNLLVCTDNSSIVLSNFKRENLDIVNVTTVRAFIEAYRGGANSKKYDTIVLDNLSSLFDIWLLELDQQSRKNIKPEDYYLTPSASNHDRRQDYQWVYNNIKRLTIEAAGLDCNTLFTAWMDTVDVVQPGALPAKRVQPKIPAKILDNVCGMVNVVAQVVYSPEEKDWMYISAPSALRIAKDQLQCRKIIKPEEIFG